MGDVAMADKPKDGDIRKKLKMDEDPLSEGEWMSLADLRYKISRCVCVFFECWPAPLPAVIRADAGWGHGSRLGKFHMDVPRCDDFGHLS
jgi:hypothetical protein